MTHAQIKSRLFGLVVVLLGFMRPVAASNGSYFAVIVSDQRNQLLLVQLRDPDGIIIQVMELLDAGER